MERLSHLYSVLWRMIIRPSRTLYELDELGPKQFRLTGSDVYIREDLQLVNHRGFKLECSHFCPTVIDNKNLKYASRRDAPCVVYLHGNCSARLEAYDVLPVLLPRGISVFCLDLSGSGLSDGDFISLGYFEQLDLKVALKYLRETCRVPAVGLWGRSMGAATAVLRSSSDPDIAACVFDSPFSSLPLVAEELVTSRHIPVPSFALRMALSVVREEVASRAGFDIMELVPLAGAPQARAPAIFATAHDDDFVLPHHTQDLFDAWGGAERKFVSFSGGHGGQRPPWFLENAAKYLHLHLSAFAQGSRPEARSVPLDVVSSKLEKAGSLFGQKPKEEASSSNVSAPSATAVLSSEKGKELKAMGFSDEWILEGLQRHSSVEAAVVWILEVSNATIEPLEKVSLRAPSTIRDIKGAVSAAEASQARGDIDSENGMPGNGGYNAAGSGDRKDKLVEELVMLGFPTADATEAARRCSSIEAAVDWLSSR
eukprot:TRINITY_DN70900_c0_g2_i1.p1 TRINITY_DN70900_c0_g2~~TRINITY_DN70900_c0_g2_i1.p1  ORF type:complete len:484 (+),score=114.71 TRINITY_DN70900_c0_g2_i1:90-1541(+)